MTLNISYCPPNITIWEIWVNHGTSQCFMDTVTSSVIAGFIFIAGTIQLCMYRKYGTEVSPDHVTRSKLYCLQIFLTLFLPILEITRFSLQATILNDKTIYGYMVRIYLFRKSLIFIKQMFQLFCFVFYEIDLKNGCQIDSLYRVFHR